MTTPFTKQEKLFLDRMAEHLVGKPLTDSAINEAGQQALIEDSEALNKSSPELHKLICEMAARGDGVPAILKRCTEFGAVGDVLRYCQHTANYQVRLATVN